MSIKVSPEQLQQVGGQINNGAMSLEDLLNQVGSQVASLQGQWTGKAQVQFEACYAEWNASAKGIRHSLAGIGQLTNQAGMSYAETENNVQRTFVA